MNIWRFEYIDVLRGQYIYRKSFSDETIARDDYKGNMYIALFSGVVIAY